MIFKKMANLQSLQSEINNLENKVTMKDQAILTTIAIICVTWIYSLVLVLKIDGQYLLPIIAVIAGLGGYAITKYTQAKEKIYNAEEEHL